jgi:hypothetical protein
MLEEAEQVDWDDELHALVKYFQLLKTSDRVTQIDKDLHRWFCLKIHKTCM